MIKRILAALVTAAVLSGGGVAVASAASAATISKKSVKVIDTWNAYGLRPTATIKAVHKKHGDMRVIVRFYVDGHRFGSDVRASLYRWERYTDVEASRGMSDSDDTAKVTAKIIKVRPLH